MAALVCYTKNKVKTFRYNNGHKIIQFEILGMHKIFDYSNSAFVYEPTEEEIVPCRIYGELKLLKQHLMKKIK